MTTTTFRDQTLNLTSEQLDGLLDLHRQLRTTRSTCDVFAKDSDPEMTKFLDSMDEQLRQFWESRRQ